MLLFLWRTPTDRLWNKVERKAIWDRSGWVMLGFPSLKISTKNTTQKGHWKMELVDMGGKMVSVFSFFKKLSSYCLKKIGIGRRKGRIQ